MEVKEKIINEGRRIEEDSLYSSKGHFYAAQFWTDLHLWIGIPATIMAAVAGASALSGHGIFAGVLALIVAALGAVATFVNPNEKAAIHSRAGNKYSALKNNTRIFCEIEIELETNTEDALLQKLKDLAKQRDLLNDESPQIPNWAFKKARRGIEEGEAHYQIDREDSSTE